MLFIINQCRSKDDKSGGQSIGQKNGKTLFFWIISTTLTKTRGGVTDCFFYSKTVQISFWNIETQITGIFASVVLARVE